jgi:DNA-binding XRE family transcriptional regulator
VPVLTFLVYGALLAFRIARAFGTDVESVFHFEETQEENV